MLQNYSAAANCSGKVSLPRKGRLKLVVVGWNFKTVFSLQGVNKQGWLNMALQKTTYTLQLTAGEFIEVSRECINWENLIHKKWRIF